jgi:hypothetical protein
MCALIASAGSIAATDTWDGGGYGDCWNTPGNWLDDSTPAATDDAVIDTVGGGWPKLCQNETIANLLMRNGTSGSPTQINTYDGANSWTLTVTNMFTVTDTDSSCYVEQLGSGEIDAASVTITAGDTAGEHATLLVSAGTLDVNGEVELNASTSVNAETELEISSGATFTPNYLDINGGSDANRDAVLDFNESVTVQSSGTDFDGYCKVDVAASKTFTALGTTIDALALESDVTIGHESGTGTFSATTMFITAGDTNDYDARFRHSSGTSTVSSELEMNASVSANAEAELYVTATGFTVGTLDVNGGDSTSRRVVLDLDQDVTSGGSDFDGFCDIDIANSMTFTAGNTRIGSDELASDVQIGFDASPGAGTFSAESISIEGGDDGGEYAILRLTSGTLSTASGERVRIREGSASGVDTDYAQLVVSSGATFSPYDMAMQGKAMIDFDADVTVSDDFEIVGANSNNPTIDLADNVDLTVNGTFAIEGGAAGVTVDPTFGSSAQIVAN